MRALRISLLAMIVASAAPLAAAQLPAPKTTDLGTGIHVIFGQGGNIGVSVGPDGAFVIDDQYQQTAAARCRAIAGAQDD